MQLTPPPPPPPSPFPPPPFPPAYAAVQVRVQIDFGSSVGTIATEQENAVKHAMSKALNDDLAASGLSLRIPPHGIVVESMTGSGSTATAQLKLLAENFGDSPRSVSSSATCSVEVELGAPAPTSRMHSRISTGVGSPRRSTRSRSSTPMPRLPRRRISCSTPPPPPPTPPLPPPANPSPPPHPPPSPPTPCVPVQVMFSSQPDDASKARLSCCGASRRTRLRRSWRT